MQSFQSMKKIRINELARELEVKPQRVLDLLPDFGVTEKKTHSSSVDEDVAERIRSFLGQNPSAREEADVSPRGSAVAVADREPETQGDASALIPPPLADHPAHPPIRPPLEAAVPKPEPPKAGPSKPEPLMPEPLHAAPAQAKPEHPEPSHPEPAHPEPVRPEEVPPVKSAPPHRGPGG